VYKQVIILRKDLNMRKGKMVAQGSHASLGAYRHGMGVCPGMITEWEWTGQTKICVGVDTEQELFNLHEKAKASALPRYLVKDAGKTEFKEPTFTALAIGPAPAEEIDKITGDLKLL
jgi:PTH2 family peptidyl-tRNA hydrolase